MIFSNEIQNKIKILFKNDSEIREQLLLGNADAVRKVGSISQKGINPEDVVMVFESNDPDNMKYLYNQCKRLVELHELYQELCYEFYKNMVDNKVAEHSIVKKKSV